MLIHLIPSIDVSIYPEFDNVELIDVCIPELNLTLNNGSELTTGCPYPNKNYLVARRVSNIKKWGVKIDRKAREGFLIETPVFIKSFSVTIRWLGKVDGEIDNPLIIDEQNSKLGGVILTHKTNFTVSDSKFDVVSTNHQLLPCMSIFEDDEERGVLNTFKIKTNPFASDEFIEVGSLRPFNHDYFDDSLLTILTHRTENIKLTTQDRRSFEDVINNMKRYPSLEHKFDVSREDIFKANLNIKVEQAHADLNKIGDSFLRRLSENTEFTIKFRDGGVYEQ